MQRARHPRGEVLLDGLARAVEGAGGGHAESGRPQFGDDRLQGGRRQALDYPSVRGLRRIQPITHACQPLTGRIPHTRDS